MLYAYSARSSDIAETNGFSNGIVSMLCAHDATARYVRREQVPRFFAVCLEPRYANVLEFLDLRKNHGKEGDPRSRPLLRSLDPRSLVSAFAS